MGLGRFGLDLSAKAIGKLRRKLDEIPGAEAKAADFLAEDYRERFDVIYAHGVLHHFRDFEVLCAELHKALRPGGVVISIDPLQSDPRVVPPASVVNRVQGGSKSDQATFFGTGYRETLRYLTELRDFAS